MEVLWNKLIRWVKDIDEGSIIHKSLTLRISKPTATTTTTTTTNHQHQRGLFATETIHCGDILIRIPLEASINGKNMTCTYKMAEIANTTSDMNGENMTKTTSTRNVSPWLRCVAALLKELQLQDERGQQPQQSSYYLDSLPQEYETLWLWSQQEIEEYFAGTRPPINDNDVTTDDKTKEIAETITSTSNPWMIMNDRTQIRRQYETTIRPYLIHCGIVNISASNNPTGSSIRENNDFNRNEKEFQQFQRACQIMSTRSFYCSSGSSSSNSNQNDDQNTTDDENDNNTKYDGPYLLPIIDLINHADTCTGDTNTKLELIMLPPNSPSSPSSCYFVMRALRTIPPNTEILHSYGDALSNVQFISSFGFIPHNRMTIHIPPQVHHDQPPLPQQIDTKPNACIVSTNAIAPIITTTNSVYTKSVILTKQEIWDTCWDMIESGLPQQLATSMIESQAFDPEEVWNVSIDKHRQADCVPNNIVIVVPPTSSSSSTPAVQSSYDIDGENDLGNKSRDSILSDELVTTACIPFLPKCAYAEITSRTLLDVSILEDYYLGQLVGAALLQARQRRLLLYRPISVSTIQRLLPSVYVPDNGMDDKEILQNLLRCIKSGNETDLYSERCRLAYGLTIRLEEKEVLEALCSAVAQLVDLHVDDNKSNSDGDQFYHDTSIKKYKTNAD